MKSRIGQTTTHVWLINEDSKQIDLFKAQPQQIKKILKNILKKILLKELIKINLAMIILHNLFKNQNYLF